MDDLFNTIDNNVKEIQEDIAKLRSEIKVYAEDADYTIENESILIIENEGSKDLNVFLPPIDDSYGRVIRLKRNYENTDEDMAKCHIIKPQKGECLENVKDGQYTLEDSCESLELVCSDKSWLILNSYGI